MLVWLIVPFYDFCGFLSVAVNSVYKLQFSYIYMIIAYRLHTCVAAWLSGSGLVSINEVTLHWARLVPGWVTVCGRVHHLGL